MKDFKEFISGSDFGDNANSSGGGMDISSILGMIAGKYEGLSEDELIREIVNEAKKGRENGTLTDADVLNFEASISPMLDDKQRRKLKKVVQYLLKM